MLLIDLVATNISTIFTYVLRVDYALSSVPNYNGTF